MSFPVITRIRRVNSEHDLDLRERFGRDQRWTLPEDQTIWSGRREKNYPAIFLWNKNDIPLTVTGEFAFPITQDKTNYRLRGSLGSFSIYSSSISIKGTGSALEFTATGFSHMGATIDSPFKVQGDWLWTVLDDARTTNISPNAGKIPLELYFSLGDDATAYGHPGVFFLELVRISFPPYESIAGKTWAALEEDIIFGVVKGLWNLGSGYTSDRPLYYDSRWAKGGVSKHLRHGSLNLESIFLKRQRCVNCFDLAALAMVTLQSLGKRPGNPHPVNVVRGLRLTTDEPWGYIHMGPLFGWEGTMAHRCNNPFWQHRVQHMNINIDAQPTVAPLDPLRTYFNRHCYCLFRPARATSEHVVDICHANIDATTGGALLISGSETISEFRDKCIDRGYTNLFARPMITKPAVINSVIA
ncbi:hypothetical protein B0T26DRAFT_873085 [Lasiosphaeria miniovina]|uniref:Uncharacterized protein n=1 Tax=Lasiosphaeria miniovina TaxID=1954250 RepID=A0AA40ABG1_9PEZI|nr:uncharacterized protein B0T26DRAFT_873085 [Lasiosphaeria miniovina]KAK0712756.1 hypothetical protein B0T26DRAFT_873085 [Lasiosphaeria miniovina]